MVVMKARTLHVGLALLLISAEFILVVHAACGRVTLSSVVVTHLTSDRLHACMQVALGFRVHSPENCGMLIFFN